MKKFTYQDIAKATGISLATISRVFNTPDIVSSETRNKVIDAVASMGIDPKAYGLSPDPSGRLIIFNVPTLRNQFYSPIIESAKKVIEGRSYMMLINEDSLADDTSFLQLLSSTKAAGVIIANAMTKEGLDAIRHRVPVVTCCEIYRIAWP